MQALFAAAPLRSQRTEPTLNERWNAYWDARAPGTPVSRRERAAQLYCNHFEATAQVAFARRTLSAEQLKPLLLIIDPPVEGLSLDNQPIHTEQLTPFLSDSGTLKLPAAWVISVGNRAPVAQLLYLPCRPVPIQIFNQRSDMEDWLSRQALIPPGLPDDNLRFEYTANSQPLTAGITELLLHPQHANAVVFASPPDLGEPPSDNGIDDEEQPLFDNLFADIPWPQRQASLNKQRDALETLLGDGLESDHQQKFNEALNALETAGQAADTAASALLYRSRTFDFVTLNREFSALYQAHKDGLSAEAQLQLALKQVNSDESSLLKAVLDTPLAADHDAASPHSLLLYWPGTGGGLQRFANRTELERNVFKIQDQDKALALQLKNIRTDPLQYSLNKQTTHFEEKAAQIRQQYPDAAQALQRANELEKLRKQRLATLQVPVPAARSLAFSHLLEQSRSAALFPCCPSGWPPYRRSTALNSRFWLRLTSWRCAVATNSWRSPWRPVTNSPVNICMPACGKTFRSWGILTYTLICPTRSLCKNIWWMAQPREPRRNSSRFPVRPATKCHSKTSPSSTSTTPHQCSWSLFRCDWALCECKLQPRPPPNAGYWQAALPCPGCARSCPSLIYPRRTKH
ncbi:hypothetical protein [Pseudomonas rossensis]|uniref:hypothetical protein n=1 Tax=Pseudomonas rossensis TaxID=2305471 RepID=UPI0032610DBB